MNKPKQTKKRKLNKYYLDRKAGNKVIKFIENFCRHTKGDLAGQNLKLLKWQKDIIMEGFGKINRETKLRQYQTIYVEVPKKNGKSTLAAPIAKYLTCADGEPGAEVYACAGDREQARIVFGVAKEMVEKDPILSARLKTFKNSIFHPKSMSVFKVVSAEAYTKEGINVHGAIFDEMHVQPNDELYNCFVTATISRKQPMIVIITTAGVKNTFGEQIHDYAVKVRDGIIKDPTWLSYIFSADVDDDPFLEATWKKANPMYNITLKKEKFEQLANRAKNEPTFLNAFKRYHLNIWVGSSSAFISPASWKECNQKPINLEDYKNQKCYGGLDLASVRDIAALVLNFPNENGGNDIFCRFYIPEETLFQKDKKDHHNYENWVKDGWMITTPGNAIDYNYIENDIYEIGGIVNIDVIGFDRWNSSQIVQNLIAEGVNMSPFGMGFASMGAPTKALEKKVLEKSLNHGGNPVLSWMIDNTEIVQDPAGNIKPAKNKSKGKIDGVIGLIISLGEEITRQNDQTKQSKYNDPSKDLLIL